VSQVLNVRAVSDNSDYQGGNRVFSRYHLCVSLTLFIVIRIEAIRCRRVRGTPL